MSFTLNVTVYDSKTGRGVIYERKLKDDYVASNYIKYYNMLIIITIFNNIQFIVVPFLPKHVNNFL